MVSLRLSGAFLLRYADRQFLALLFQEPPRRTRFVSPIRPVSTTLDYASVTDEAIGARCNCSRRQTTESE